MYKTCTINQEVRSSNPHRTRKKKGDLKIRPRTKCESKVYAPQYHYKNQKGKKRGKMDVRLYNVYPNLTK